jgi:sec-independent protein translocase protein TatC
MKNTIKKKLQKETKFLFKFQNKKKTKKLNVELTIPNHIEELRQRTSQILIILILISLFAFFNIKEIIKLLEIPAQNINFFQLSPSEYFLETIKISIYTGIILISPIFLNQIIFFIIPGLTLNEKKLVLPLLFTSIILLFLSLIFAFFFLIPTALKFFISYSVDVIEPLWAFSQYCDFILLLFTTTALAFQIPIFQIILGILNIVTGRSMLNLWKYVTLFSAIISAILTPSTDPLTQILLASAIIILYLIGAGILIVLKK